MTAGSRRSLEAEDAELLVLPAGAPYDALAAERIYAALQEATALQETVVVALAGGSTPRAVYRALVERSGDVGGLDWGRMRFYFGDERAVPAAHADSNYRMARESLFLPLGIPDEHVWAMPGAVVGEGARREAARRYAEKLPQIDLLLLGLGEDGHTASLFPGAPALDEPELRVCAVDDAPKAPRERMTITPPTVGRARRRIVLAHGLSKAPALRDVFCGPFEPKRVPAQLALRGLWIVDEAAASLMEWR